jgi:hypothetical protein
MPEFLHRLLCCAVLFGEVVCILGATPAPAQNVPAPAPPHPSEAVMSSGVGPFMAGTSQLEMFAAFLREIGAGDLAASQETITGRQQPCVNWTMVNRTTIGLSDGEWKTAYAILLDGSQQVSEWSDQMQDALGWRNGRFEADAAQRAARKAKFERFSARGDAIVEQTILRLRRQLGNEAFSKLDAFVSHRESDSRSVDRGPIRKGPVETAQIRGTAARP